MAEQSSMQILPRPEQGPVLFEIYTSRTSGGNREVRTRFLPLNTSEPTFAEMMVVPPQRHQDIIQVPRLFEQQRRRPTLTGANGPGQTRPQLGDRMRDPSAALERVIDHVMEIYPNLGEDQNAQNLTSEQSDVIRGALQEADLPPTTRMQTLILREVILRTSVKTPLAEEELEKLETKKFSEMTEEERSNDKCPICLCEYSDDEEIRKMVCEHFFHTNCIDHYLKNYNNTCPMCRENQTMST